MLTVCMERKRFSLKMVIDSEIEMPSRFYIATLFQLLNVVKDSCFALGWEKNCHADGKINNEMDKWHLGCIKTIFIHESLFFASFMI